MISGAALRVLSCFFDTDALSFTDLCRQTSYPTDLGGYYIRQLISSGCVTRTGRGIYNITPRGKQQLITASPRPVEAAITSPRVCVMAVPMQNDHYIIMRRKRQPYIGYAEWPAGRVLLGEELQEQTRTMLHSRLGVSAELQFIGFYRRIDLVDGTVFDDKLFAVHVARVAEDARLQPESEIGHNIPATAAEIETMPHAHGALRDILHFVRQPESYREARYQLSPEDMHI
jgi:ADP-ribose pyrophosphatase YjhB (NUDIX family)